MLAEIQLASSVKVGLIDTGRPPYFWPKESQKQIKGFYIDLLEAISRQSGIRFEYRYVPQNRLRRAMISGDLDLEPGIDPNWRQDSGEAESSLYSVPFFTSHEVIISHKPISRSIKKLNDLEQGKLCHVLGFSYDENNIHKPAAFLNEYTIIEMLARKRCDYAVIPQDIANHLSHDQDYELNHSRPRASFRLRMRLNKGSAHLLPAINEAITALLEQGVIDNLLKKYEMTE